ncbi:MAG: glycosyl hydrolase, partial [Candidatus Aminicenantes bacterium]
MKKGIFSSRFLLVLCLGLAVSLFLGAKKTKKEPEPLLKESILDGLRWRCIGPSNMGGRIDDFAVVESNPKIIYAGTASGGVWKTTNNGVTWEPIFDDQITSTIGDVTVAPSNPGIIWVGTGEPNNRQSSSWGDG